MGSKKEQPYYLKVTMESGSDEGDKPYQKTTFLQNYDSHEQQVEEQQKLFPQVAMAVSGSMIEAGQAYLDGKQEMPSGPELPQR